MTTTPQKRPAFEPASELLKPVGVDPDMPRPISTVAGAVLVFLRVVVGVVLIASVARDWPNWVRDLDVSFDDLVPTPELVETSLLVLVLIVGVFLAIDAVLAVFILRGRNWARVVVMTFSAVSITASFVQWWAGGLEITIATTLLSLGLDILILLALSSRSAAAYARRHERR